jgi:hypothetical protein
VLTRSHPGSERSTPTCASWGTTMLTGLHYRSKHSAPSCSVDHAVAQTASYRGAHRIMPWRTAHGSRDGSDHSHVRSAFIPRAESIIPGRHARRTRAGSGAVHGSEHRAPWPYRLCTLAPRLVIPHLLHWELGLDRLAWATPEDAAWGLLSSYEMLTAPARGAQRIAPKLPVDRTQAPCASHPGSVRITP